ncbi:hypothetical protein Esti_004232 [Eimeria stiedai]
MVSKLDHLTKLNRKGQEHIMTAKLRGFQARLRLPWNIAGVVAALLLVRGESPAAAYAKPSSTHAFAAGDRLAPGSTILLSVGAEEVSAVTQALPFHFANVTIPEQHLASYRDVGATLTHDLAKRHSTPLKKLRTSAVQCVERPLKVKVVNDYNVVCLEGGVAMLTSLTNIHVKKGAYFGSLVVHYESGGTAYSATRALPLAALNPVLWGTDQPRDIGAFRGTAICLREGEKLQLVEGWPVRAPQFKEGPWDINVTVERAFLTPSNSKNEHLFHADLKVIKVPREVTFVHGPQPTKMPFAGYIKLPSKYHGLEAAIIRNRILGKTCRLRRTEAKSTVELKCDQLIDAKVASLNRLYAERPPLLKTLRNAGLLIGGSMGAFSLAAFMQILGNIDGTKPLGDPDGCMALGAVSGIVGILALMVESPRLGLKYLKWKRKYNRKARRIVEQAVTDEMNDPATHSSFLDLVLVIPPPKYGTGDNFNVSAETATASEKQGAVAGYGTLAGLMMRRAEEATLKQLPFDKAELKALGMQEPVKNAGEKDEAAKIGLVREEDGKLVLPPHLSTTGMFETLTESLKSLIEDLLNTPPHASFAVQLLKARLTRENLWEVWTDMRGLLSAAATSTSQQVDTVPLSVWLAVYEKLGSSKALLEAAKLAPQLKSKLQTVHEEQTTAMEGLLAARVGEEVDVLEQVLANLQDEEQGEQLELVGKKIEELEIAVETAKLPDRLIQPILHRFTRRMNEPKEEPMDLEPLEVEEVLEVPTPSRPPFEHQPEFFEDFDSNVEFVEIDDIPE